MNDSMFHGKWSELAVNLRQYFEKLSDEDVTAVAGDGDKLMALLNMRYGYSDEQAQDAWDRFIRRYGHT